MEKTKKTEKTKTEKVSVPSEKPEEKHKLYELGIFWVVLTALVPALVFFLTKVILTKTGMKSSSVVGIAAALSAISTQVPIIGYFLVSMKDTKVENQKAKSD